MYLIAKKTRLYVSFIHNILLPANRNRDLLPFVGIFFLKVRFFGLTPLLRKRIEHNFFILYFRPFFVFGYMHIPFGFSVPRIRSHVNRNHRFTGGSDYYLFGEYVPLSVPVPPFNNFYLTFFFLDTIAVVQRTAREITATKLQKIILLLSPV